MTAGVVLRLLFVLVGLQLPWPGLAHWFVTSAARLANVMSALGEGPLHWAASAAHSWSLSLQLQAANGRLESFVLDARVLLFRPLVVLLALFFAFRGWRSWSTSIVATASVLAFMSASVLLPIVVQRHELGRQLLPQTLADGLFTLWGMLAPPSTAYLLPCLLWLVASMLFTRRRSLQDLRGV